MALSFISIVATVFSADGGNNFSIFRLTTVAMTTVFRTQNSSKIYFNSDDGIQCRQWQYYFNIQVDYGSLDYGIQAFFVVDACGCGVCAFQFYRFADAALTTVFTVFTVTTVFSVIR